jgi:hypothetical protein
MKWRTPLLIAHSRSARIHGIVAIIAERIAHRIRHDQRGGKVNDGPDIVFADEPQHERLIAGFADDERYARGNGPTMPGREIIEYDALAGIGQRINHLAADKAGAAGDQNRHGCRLANSLGCDCAAIGFAYTDSVIASSAECMGFIRQARAR